MVQPLKKKKFWIQKVKESSNVINLPQGIFTHSPERIAQLLKEAVLENEQTTGTEFQTAMSMLNYYINHAGKKLHAHERARLEQAKVELRKIFGKI